MLGNDNWTDENGVQYETLPAPSGRMRASSPRPGHGMLQNESILIQDPDRVDKIEETIKALTQKEVELQQQGNTTMGTRDLLNIMEQS